MHLVGLEFGPRESFQAWVPGEATVRYAKVLTFSMLPKRQRTKGACNGVSEYKGAILIDVICWQVTAIDGATGALDDSRYSFEVKIAASDQIG